MNILEFLKDKDNTNWTKDKASEDLWSYCKFNTILTVGRQRWDWAIYWYGRNVGFYYGENYKDIPEELVNDIKEYLVKSEDCRHA